MTIKLYTSDKACPKDAFDAETLGGKGLGLFELQAAGAPVPEFAVIPTDLAVLFMEDQDAGTDEAEKLAKAAAKHFEKLGYPLLSVRSGARVSMPGMMDTILNVGVFSKECQPGVSKMPKRLAEDCRRRFLSMYGTSVMGLPAEVFEKQLAEVKAKAKKDTDAELTIKQLEQVTKMHKEFIAPGSSEIDGGNKAELYLALRQCILAVLRSWSSPRAIAYRKEQGIPDDWGTAVVIQRMVFGNKNQKSGSGVLFSRDPATGANEIQAEYLDTAQGEDVVSGIRTPVKLALDKNDYGEDGGWMDELVTAVVDLENDRKEMLDIEFTVEDEKLYFLQVRTAKRTARASVRCALDMLDEGMIKKTELFQRVKRREIAALMQPVIDPSFNVAPHATAIAASGGVVSGEAVYDPQAAIDCTEPCVLVRHETSPDDIEGMFASIGVLTATGGFTSHAAVVARGINKAAVVGCVDLNVTARQLGPYDLAPGTKITIDGSTGNVWVGIEVPVISPDADEDIDRLMQLAGLGKKVQEQYRAAMPDGSGKTYTLSQFISDPPVPDAPTVNVVDDRDTSQVIGVGVHNVHGLTFMDVYKKMQAWAQKNQRYVHFYTALMSEADTPKLKWIEKRECDRHGGLRGLMTRLVTMSEIEFELGPIADVEQLIAPAPLEKKFKIVNCPPYDLMRSFGE